MYNFYTLDELLFTDLVDGIMFQKHTLDLTEINFLGVFFGFSEIFKYSHGSLSNCFVHNPLETV